MNTIEFPFELGTDYEDWELDLEILPDRVPHYDSYMYVGKDVKFFLNNITYKPELVYNLDVLEAVMLTFKMSTASFNKMNTELTKRFSKPSVEVKNNVELHHYTLESLYACSCKSSDEIHLVYSSNYCLHTSLLSSLI